MRELNLLPPTRRRLIDQQATLNIMARLIRHVVTGLIVITALGLLSLAGLYAGIIITGSAANTDLAAEIENYQDRREEIARQNSSLKQLHEISTGRVIWSEIIPELLTVVPAGTVIAQISGDQISQPRLDFKGHATSRTSLIALTERLQSLPWAKSVRSPHSNLIERINPSYSFSVEIVQLEEEDD